MNEILSILGSIGFNWHVALANFVNFLIILFILNKFFFKKIGSVLATRRETIERGVREAKEAQEILSNAHKEKHSILTDAHKEGQDIISSSAQKGEAIAKRIVQEGEESIAQQKKLLATKEKELAANVEQDFLVHAPELVASLYAKALRTTMDAKSNDELIARIAKG
jgi:F-type H+-transporting ATPase subunit b